MEGIAKGLAGVVVTETKTSEVDGEAGKLVIGGFDVEEIAPRATFEEMLHLLWHGRLPRIDELRQLSDALASARSLPAATIDLLRAAAAAETPTMDALRMGIDSLSLVIDGKSDAVQQACELVARFPTIVAAHWRMRNGREPVAPDPALPHVANYLYMLNGEPPEPEVVRALETYLNTVIDHGMNASTFTARVVIGTRSDLVSALVAAVGALKGPLHGGAPGPALDMVFDIRSNAAKSGRSIRDEALRWARAVVARNERIMGFGHRVYRVRDPRADVLAGASQRLFERSADPRLYADAREVETAVLEVLREHRPERRLDTNVEFYTALILHGVGLPTELFTPTFAIGRAGGWIAHGLEQIAEDTLIRPTVRYVGGRSERWVAAEARG